MKNLMIGLLVVAVIFVLASQRKNRKRVEHLPPDTEVAENVSTQAPLASPMPTVAAPRILPAPPANPAPASTPMPVAKEEVNPYHIDRFSLRELDQPVPSSATELMAKLTEFKRPLLPTVLPGQEADGDGDILTGPMRGYFEVTGGGFKRIQLSRESDGIELAIESGPREFQQWLKNDPQIKFNNFNDDPYSLVITLPDRRVIYLKFYSRLSFIEVDHKVRALKGWILAAPGAGGKVPSRMALVGDLGLDYWGPGPVDPYEKQWPNLESIKAILPKNQLPP